MNSICQHLRLTSNDLNGSIDAEPELKNFICVFLMHDSNYHITKVSHMLHLLVISKSRQ